MEDFLTYAGYARSSASGGFVESDYFMAATTLMLNVLAWVQAEAAGPSAQEGQQNHAPELWSKAKGVLNLGHF